MKLRSGRLPLALVLTALPVSFASTALAQVGAPPPTAGPAPALAELEADEPPIVARRDVSARLDRSSGFGLGLDAYGGLGLMIKSGQDHSHAFVGALSRVRYKYFQCGASLELSDRAEDRFRSVGAFVGAFLPFKNWVDLDVAAGAALRRYINPDERYGPGGYDVGLPALTLRMGLSDRTSESVLAARLSAGIVASLDLGRRNVDWRYEVESETARMLFQGRSTVGGATIGLVLGAGFDVGVRKNSTRTRDLMGARRLPARY